MLDKQGAQLFAIAVLVVSRTWISDRIASLNGILPFLLLLLPDVFDRAHTLICLESNSLVFQGPLSSTF